MDIEERAEKYARDHVPTREDGTPLRADLIIQWTELLRDAYLAGSEQTQADYATHYEDDYFSGLQYAKDRGWDRPHALPH